MSNHQEFVICTTQWIGHIQCTCFDLEEGEECYCGAVTYIAKGYRTYFEIPRWVRQDTIYPGITKPKEMKLYRSIQQKGETASKKEKRLCLEDA